MAKPTFADMRTVNTWWQQGLDKERKRFTNAPKGVTPRHQFEVVEKNSQFAPLPGQVTAKKAHARRHR